MNKDLLILFLLFSFMIAGMLLINQELLPSQLFAEVGNVYSRSFSLQGLCSSYQDCSNFCSKNPKVCIFYCDKNPNNSLCSKISKQKVGDVSMQGICYSLDQCVSVCNKQKEICYDFCKDNPDNKFCQQGFDYDEVKVKLLIHKNFIDLEQFDSISKYRSCQGHLVTTLDNEETQRTLKHYFKVKRQYINTDDKVEIYAPFDGYVAFMAEDRCRKEGKCYGGGELWFFPIEGKERVRYEDMFGFNIIHIKPKQGLKNGDVIRAGRLLGYGDFLGGYNTVDIAIAKPTKEFKQIDGWDCPYAELDSVFKYMYRDVAIEYMKKGIRSKRSIIIDKEYRDNNLCDYENSGPFFASKYQGQKNDWLILK